MRELECHYALTAADAAVSRDLKIVVDGSRIASVSSGHGSAKRLFVLPPLINAHDHARYVRSSSFGSFGRPLEVWLHYLALLPSVDPYLASVFSFARSALGGVGTVMVHYTRTQGLTDLPTEAAEVARAARDIGLRVGFAVAMRDRNPLVYGSPDAVLKNLPSEIRDIVSRTYLRPSMPVRDQMQLVEDVAANTQNPNFNVQYGPAGVQWCTHELLEAIAEASERTGRRVHMHMLETKYQRHWADINYPNGMFHYLDEIGLLSPRLTLAHCTWTNPEELELLVERGVTIALNTSSNLALRSGVAPLARMMQAGCRVALGLDGVALDEDDDALREMRLGHFLHAGHGFDVAVSREQMLEIALSNGRRSVLNIDKGVHLANGEPADVMVLDWAALDEDRLREDIDPLDLLMSRARAKHIHELIVDGRTIVERGVIPNFDLLAAHREIMDRVRAGIRENTALTAALPLLEEAVGSHFGQHCACG